MDIYEVIKRHGETITSVAEKMGVTRPSLSISLKKPSYTTLERIASALNVEPWQLLAPPSVMDEMKEARAARDGVGGCALVGVVRVGNEIYTADNVQQLRAIVERLERQT